MIPAYSSVLPLTMRERRKPAAALTIPLTSVVEARRNIPETESRLRDLLAYLGYKQTHFTLYYTVLWVAFQGQAMAVLDEWIWSTCSFWAAGRGLHTWSVQ